MNKPFLKPYYEKVVTIMLFKGAGGEALKIRVFFSPGSFVFPFVLADGAGIWFRRKRFWAF